MKIYRISNANKVLQEESLLKDFLEGEMIALFHAGTRDEDDSIIENGLEAKIGDWVKQCLYGATDDEDCINDIIEKTKVVYFSKKPSWVIAKVKEYKHQNGLGREVNYNDIVNYGQLTIVGVPIDAYNIYEKDINDDANSNVKSFDGYKLHDVPFGVERGDIFAMEDMEVDITLVGEDLLLFLKRNYPEELKGII